MAHPDLLKVVVLSTMSILSVLLEASAETSQPTHSFANMPIFIAVALIGAAVGGASLQRLGKYRKAMNCYYKVLELSKETCEDSSSTEAYGAIADCYVELGDLERAAKLYDKYMSRLQPGD